jgi:PEGA domain
MGYRGRSLAVVLSMVLGGAVARAEPSPADRATARALADEAGDALDKKNYEVAMDKFERADALVHAPTLLLGVARAQVGLSKFVEAQENYQRILREGVPPGAPPAFAKALQDAERELKAIAPKLAWVTISVKEPPTSVVNVDGSEIPRAALDVKRAVNPGQHVVKATADGYEPGTRTFTAVEGESTAVSLKLERRASVASAPAPEPRNDANATASMTTSRPEGSSPSRQKTYGWIGLGVGGAGIVVGSITGLMAMSRHSTLESDCPEGRCRPEGQGTIDGFRSIATVSTVSFIVGGVAAAAGGALLLTAPSATQTAHVQPFVGVGNVGARVTF